MKNRTKLMSIVLCVIFALTIFSPITALADNTIESLNTLAQEKVSKVENQLASLNSSDSITVSNYTELKNAIDNKIKNIIVSENIQLEDTLQIGYSIYLHSSDNEKTILSPTSLRHIKITSENILIAFDNIILDGNCTNSRKDVGGGIDAPFKNIEIYGANIQKCSADLGSAINNELEGEMGTFSMYNCTISNNLRSETVFTISLESLIYNCFINNNKGSGMALGPSDEIYRSNVVIYDCQIKNNSGYDGSGLNLYWSDVYINENTVIENNSADKGGGIYTWECNLENHATIKNNTADNGAGIYAYNSEIVNYSNISNNTAKKCGGGISLEGSTFILDSGEISYNKAGSSNTNAEHNSGGICIYSASQNDDVTINGGIIKNNYSSVGGGIGYMYSVYSNNKSNIPSVIVNGGKILNNGYSVDENGNVADITNEGGGIFGCKVEMNGGSIENNLARYGAGIKTLDFIMTDGAIQNNGYYLDKYGNETLVNYWGGGVYTYGNTAITGGTINSNQAERGAGLYIVNNITLNSNANVEYNKAHDVGGGIYFYHLVDTKNTDMNRLKNNTALIDGDQYYVF